MSKTIENSSQTGFELAVIGMSGRFPGAGNIDEFWDNLKNGVESLSFLSNKELEEPGMSSGLPQDENYVKTAGGLLENKEYFDPSFFNYTPIEAEVMNPQMRIFHECAWEALEDAGYGAKTYNSSIGIYAGASSSFYWEGLTRLSGKSEELGSFESDFLNNSNFMAIRIAYKLGLKGPAFTVQTACSTSLVAIHLACQGLLNGECDMALAGGVTILTGNIQGYRFKEGMILSPDGHCRAFDAKAMGTAVGYGAGIVLLKSLEDAIADRDHIYALIKGTAVNNDGMRKIGYTAPSIEGQAEVIRMALQVADAEPESIRYVETHGTGTVLGDPIEFQGLKLAFNTDKKGFCAIGSVKTNIGHLDAAAGAAGFIKTVLALKHRLIPPSLHFESPNPKIDFENSPFYVNQTLSGWTTDNRYPLRAGVSSFGIGGTNAHAILEEWRSEQNAISQDRLSPPYKSRDYQLILLSAKSESALEQMTQNLANHLKNNPASHLTGAAYTLQVGRRHFKHRRTLVCSESSEAARALSSPLSAGVSTAISKKKNRPVIFMFPGLGPQYVNMARELYEKEPQFQKEMDRCFEILEPLMDCNLKEILYPSAVLNRSYRSNRSYTPNMSDIDQTEIAPAAIFIVEYSLAKLLMGWGIKPQAMIGYSFGEYAAACVSGVFSLEDALALVVRRARLIQKVPEGAMLSVPLPLEDITPLLTGELSIAIDNGPSCITAGSTEIIDTFERQMKERKVLCMRLPVSRAIHSKMMEPILKEFKEILGKITLNKPRIQYISNLTGNWLTPQEAADPAYWTRHLRGTVRFADGIKQLLKEENALFLEIGPGRDISALALRHIEAAGNSGHRVISLVRHPGKDIPDVYFLLSRLGRLWLLGAEIDWHRFYPGKKPHRIPLPTYPFERHRYWIDGDIGKIAAKALGENLASAKKSGITDWFYIPSWKRFPVQVQQPGEIPSPSCWLVFIDDCGLGPQLVKQLQRKKQAVVTVKTGNGFVKENHNQFTINPREDNHYHALFNELRRLQLVPDRIVHLWCVTPDRSDGKLIDIEHVPGIQDLGFYSLLTIARAIGKLKITNAIQLAVVTNNLQEVTGNDGQHPEKATVLGPVKAIPAEYANIKCRSIDVMLPSSSPGTGTNQKQKLVRQLWEELISGSVETTAAYRGDYRWILTFAPIRLKEPEKNHLPLKQAGVYLITGGTGGIGLELARYLAKEFHAKLVLTSRTQLPPKDQWEQWLMEPGKHENLKRKIQKIKELEESGAAVMVCCADVSNPGQMQKVIARAKEQFHAIDGVIHCAGLPDGEMIQRRTRDKSAQIFKSKILGTLVLDRLLHVMKKKPGFFLLCSSVASILPMLGQAGYSAANAFLDAYARYRNIPAGDNNHMLTVSVNWDRWRNIGIANILETQHKKLTGKDLAGGITGPEGVETFQRVLANKQSQVVVSPHDIEILFEKAHLVKPPSLTGELKETVVPGKTLPRPQLDSEYIPPDTKTEETLANLWAGFFGYDKIGTRDDFFELGGDSLKAMVIASKIHKELNIELPFQEFFNRPTIEGLVEYIEQITEKTTYVPIETAEEKEYYSLASAQKRLYILQQMEPGNISYNQSNVAILEGQLEKDRLEKTFRKLLQRHEGLRTSFEMINGEPLQRIHAEVDFEIEYYDISEVEEKKQTTEDRRQGTEEKGQKKETQGDTHPSSVIRHLLSGFIRPFDLTRPPLLRVGLIKLPVGRTSSNILMVDMHHITADGISIGILKEDFMLLYGERELPALRIRCRDFSEWQKPVKGKQTAKSPGAFWLKEYAGEIPVLNLPTDYTRPEIQEFKGNATAFEIKNGQLTAIKALARANEATLYMLLLSIYTILLAKLAGQEDIVVGTPTAGRKHPDLQPVIGMFANTLALRNYPVGEKTFREFFAGVKQRTLQALENQDYPFEDLVEQAAAGRDLSRNPIFDVMFVLQNMERRGMEIEGLKLKPYNFEYGTAKFDMTLTGVEYEKGLLLTIEYMTGLFKETTIQRFIKYFKIILEKVLDNSEIKLKEIEIISAEEKNRLLYDFNQTDAHYPQDKTVHRLFENQAEQTPHQIALVDSGQWDGGLQPLNGFIGTDPGKANINLTYNRLNQKSHRLACWLQEKGVVPDTIVAILVERSIEMIIGIFGILKAGGAYLPIDPGYPEERIQYMLKDSNANFLVTTPGLSEKLSIVNCQLLIVNDMPPKSRRLNNPPKEANSINNYQLTINNLQLESSNLAYIIYTSGSTGKPKGVMIRHYSLVNRLNWMQKKYRLDSRDTILQKTPFTFDVSLWELFWWAIAGARLCLLVPGGEKTPSEMVDAVQKNHITVVHFVPSMLKVFLEFIKESGEIGKLSSLKRVIASGEALTASLVKLFNDTLWGFNHTGLSNLYGPTEATVDVSFFDCPVEGPIETVPIGKPIDNIKLYILDGYLNLQPVGITGELGITGDGLARGYLNRQELTAEKFVKHMSYRSFMSCIYLTGDLARWLDDGSIEFLGRIDHQVKIRGFRVELGEIESQLLKHKKIKQAVVLPGEPPGRVQDKKPGQHLTAYIVPGGEITIPALKDHLSKELPAYMIPSHFVRVEKIPLTPNGKIDRNALTGSGVHLKTGVAFTPPRNDTEKKIAAIWKEVLQLDRVGIHENFFDLGGTSLDVIRVNMKLKEIFNENEIVMLMFRYTTIGSFARYLDQKAGKAKEAQQVADKPVHIEKIKKSRASQRSKRRG